MSDLNDRLLAAHAEGDHAALVHLYAEAADRAPQIVVNRLAAPGGHSEDRNKTQKADAGRAGRTDMIGTWCG